MEPFVIQDLGMVVVAHNHNPTILNPDFLRTNHIVPDNWELASPPFCSEPVASVSYETGVNITAQADNVAFTESIAGKDRKEVVLPEVAARFAQTLRYVNYRALGINPTGYILFGEDAVEQVREFIIKRFLAAPQWGAWKQPPSIAGITLGFKVDPWIMNVKIESAIVQLPERRPTAGILVSGNFHKDLSGKTVDERLQDLLESLKRWQTALDYFAEFVGNVLKP
jgi:hypothetical protein